MADDDGVLSGSGGDGEFDLRVGGGELGEERLDEATAVEVSEGFSRVSCRVRAYFMPLELPAQSQ